MNDARAFERIVHLQFAGAVPSRTPLAADVFSVIVAPSVAERTQTRAPANLKRFNLLYLGATLLHRTLDQEELFRRLQQHVQRVVALQSPRRVFVRGCVLQHEGRTILVPADPWHRALIEALRREGATSFSTSYAVCDAHGNVYRYASASSDPVPEVPDGRDVADSLPLHTVLFPRPTSALPVRELTRAQAILRLLPHTVVGRLRPRFALAMLARSLRRAVAFEVIAGPMSIGVMEGGRHVSTRASSPLVRAGDRS